MEKMKEEQEKIRLAVEKLLEQADLIAAGKAEYMSYEDVFGASNQD